MVTTKTLKDRRFEAQKLRPPGVCGAGEKGYLFSGSWGVLVIILGELGSKHILLEI